MSTRDQSPSPFQMSRAAYQPRFPAVLNAMTQLKAKPLDGSGMISGHSSDAYAKDLQILFPKLWGQAPIHFQAASEHALPRYKTVYRVGVVLSGGPAPGGHNVIVGITEALKELSTANQVFGCLGGPAGILNDRWRELSLSDLAYFRNSGGFDLLGSGRTKIDRPEEFARCQQVLETRGIQVLIMIGGDDSNTNAALLAEYLLAAGSSVRVVGVPKTIDGDLKNDFVETSFGFDTAVRVYADLIANIARDTLSAKKYYHFVRLMGRSASHITLEAALQTQPNMTLIAEEMAEAGKTLRQVVADIAAIIKDRAAAGKNFGIILVPEGMIEFIPEIKALIGELNDILAAHKTFVDTLSGFTEQSEYVNGKLSRDAAYTFSGLPIDIQRQLLMDRDPHGNVVVSGIETEKLLVEMLRLHLSEEKAEGRYQGTFSTQRHFLGYEGRCAAPSNFDADYAYSLGRVAVALVMAEVTGYMSVVRHLTKDRQEWQALGVPLTAMMTLEQRRGQRVPVIRKSLVDLNGKSIQYLNKHRRAWATGDHYRSPGPIQYFGPAALCDKVPCTLALDAECMSQVAW